MGFKIENVGKQQNISVGNININIGGIKTAEGQNKLKTFLGKVYDTDSNGELNKHELLRVKDEYGKEITEEKLNAAFKLFVNKEVKPQSKLTPVMKKAIETINKKLYGKTVYYAISKDNNGEERALPQNLSKYVAGCKDPAKLQEISSYYTLLLTALIRFARRSDHHAQIILGTLNENALCFGFSIDKNAAKIMGEEDFLGTYDWEQKNKRVINIPQHSFDNHNFISFEEILIHEATHALDDIKVDDASYYGRNAASFNVFYDQIKGFAEKDIQSINSFASEIPEVKSLWKQMRSSGNNTLYYLDGEAYLLSNESAEVIKQGTWMWVEEESEGEKNISIYNSFTAKYNEYAKDGKLDTDEEGLLLMEYIATAAQFYLSPDKSKRERMKKHNPGLCAFLEKTFLPAMLKNRRL